MVFWEQTAISYQIFKSGSSKTLIFDILNLQGSRMWKYSLNVSQMTIKYSLLLQVHIVRQARQPNHEGASRISNYSTQSEENEWFATRITEWLGQEE